MLHPLVSALTRSGQSLLARFHRQGSEAEEELHGSGCRRWAGLTVSSRAPAACILLGCLWNVFPVLAASVPLQTGSGSEQPLEPFASPCLNVLGKSPRFARVEQGEGSVQGSICSAPPWDGLSHPWHLWVHMQNTWATTTHTPAHMRTKQLLRSANTNKVATWVLTRII